MQLDKIEKSLSSQRLNSYKLAASDTQSQLLGRYLWNIALSQSLYPALHLAEVTLRNRVHHAATEIWGSNWKTNPRVLLPAELEIVKQASFRLQKDSKQSTPPDLIAALHFGFWTSLFTHRYEILFFRKTVKSSFPYLHSSQRTRNVIMARLDRIRSIRNRVFHYEPIWRYQDLGKIHAEIVEGLNWMCQDTPKILEKVDQFNLILKNGPTQYEF